MVDTASPISRVQPTDIVQEDLHVHLEKSGFQLKKQSLRVDVNENQKTKQWFTSPTEKASTRKSGTQKNGRDNKFISRPAIREENSQPPTTECKSHRNFSQNLILICCSIESK